MGRLLLFYLVAHIFEAAGNIDFTSLRKMSHIVYGRAECVVRRKYMKCFSGNVEIVHSKCHVKADVCL